MTLKEHIDDIHENLEKDLFTSEAAVCDYIVRRLLVDALDWPRHSPDIVIREYGVEGTRVDFALCDPPSKPRVFIEVKKVGNIEGGEKQLFQYAFHQGVPIAVLTDGREWQFYHPTAQGNYRERRVYKLDLIERDSEESARYLNRYLNYNSIRTGEAVKKIEADYRSASQQREIKKRLPEVWSELVQEKNEDLLLVVMDAVKNKIGHEPTEEQVLDFLKSLERKIGPDKGNGPSPSGSRKKNKGLFVTMPNGEQINHKVSAITFVEVIEKIGVERVKNLRPELKVNATPLISTSDDPTYNQHKSGRYYIMTQSSTKRKKRLLEKIASELSVQLQVEIVDKL